MTISESPLSALDGVVGPSLEAAGFTRSGTTWLRSGVAGVNAFSAFTDGTRVVMAWGWSYPALGDPPPEPADVRGCARQMALDEVAPTSDLKSLTDLPNLDDPAAAGRWAQRLTVAWNRAVVPWLDRWGRPDGYRDFLASRSLHLGAAWVSAELGHCERAQAELAVAAPLARLALSPGFDRRRAELDVAIAAPFAARHGLGAALGGSPGGGGEAAPFEQERGRAAGAKVTAPETEHARLQQRQEVLAETCRQWLAG